jgi:histidinol-phosphate aminotransferase
VRPDLADLPAYRPGRALTAPQSPRTFKCSSNENPFPPLPSVLAAIAQAASSVNRYPDLTCSRLVDALAHRLEVPPEAVVCGPGSVGVLQQLVAAVAVPGDEVVFAWRSFEAYPIVTRVAGATPVPVPLAAGGRHDLAAMLAAVTPATRAVLVCTPNNPTGPAVEREQLASFVAAVPPDVLVVVDEAYAELVRDPRAADGVALSREHPNVAVLRTFSKAYGLAGLRVGYGVAAPAVADAVRRTSIPFGVSSLAEAAALAALEAEDELFARVDALVVERERVLEALRGCGWDVPDSQANFVWLPAGSGSEELAAACAAAGVAVRTFPGEGVRVTVAEPEANDCWLEAARAHAHGAGDGVARARGSR